MFNPKYITVAPRLHCLASFTRCPKSYIRQLHNRETSSKIWHRVRLFKSNNLQHEGAGRYFLNGIYIPLYTVDIEGLLGFIFRRGHNNFNPGLFDIVYLVLSFRPAPGTSISKGLIKSISLLKYK